MKPKVAVSAPCFLMLLIALLLLDAAMALYAECRSPARCPTISRKTMNQGGGDACYQTNSKSAASVRESR
jgi:hypothetical protein